VIELASLGVDGAPLLKVLKYDPPPQRQKGIMVKDAAELVAALKQKGLA
jgi:electron transfer flavoprotein beta subunit